MALDLNLNNTHAVAFPSKIHVGHLVNLVLQQNTDNGAIRGLGDYVSFDNYKDTDVTTFEGKIIDKGTGTNNSYYVRVTKFDPLNPPLFVCEVIDNAMTNYDSRFKDDKLFYNAKGDVVRAYVLDSVADVFEVSAEGFVGTPAVGATVTAQKNTGKLVVG